MTIELTVNGETRTVTAAPLTPLAEVLREELYLTGTKQACGEGFCGSCTVLLDDAAAPSCLTPVGMAAGKAVRTIESLAPGMSELSPLQQAMKDADAVQCGMCFPGILMGLTALLARQPEPTEDDVRTALSGHLCRCTGYARIVDAALSVCVPAERGV
ncbi:MAG: (2Fe-2S)-binding protein [Frankiales bacterium]|nr:(2Fe-2S)-binding protein [Frankiales bacterium]